MGRFKRTAMLARDPYEVRSRRSASTETLHYRLLQYLWPPPYGTELRSCVKVEEDVLGSPSLISLRFLWT